MLQGVYDRELRRVAAVVAAIWQLLLLVQVLIYLGDYRQPVVPIAVWAGMLAAAVWLVPRAWAVGLTGLDSAAAVAVAVIAVLVVGLERRQHGATGTVDWSVVGTGWLLALVAVSRRAYEWVCGAVLVFTIHAIVAARVLGLGALGLARLASTAYTLLVILVVFAAVRPMFRASARIAARRSELASRSAAERAAAAAVREDRRRRLDVLESEALPLLRGIADGRLDPSAAAVRDQCGQSAAELRRALVDRASARSELLAELEPVLADAGERGLPVEIRTVGDPGYVSRQVIRWAVAAVDHVLRALGPQQVVLTMLAPGDEVELYLVFRGPLAQGPLAPRAPAERPPAEGPPAEGTPAQDTSAQRPPAEGTPAQGPPAQGCRTALEVDDSGMGCLEVRWPKEVPS